MSRNIKIMVACHKESPVPQDPMYVPVFVGAKGKEDIGFQRDDIGDNISEKNPLYCELTGLYWCWKNLDCDYFGLVHYRRYFTMHKGLFKGKNTEVLTGEQCESLLDQYSVILPKKRNYYIATVYDHYANTFDGAQFDAAQQVLDEYYPEYGACFRKLMNQRSCYLFNMFIMSKERTDRYCEWLFDVCEKIEARYDASALTPFEKRYIGRVSERLFNAWLMVQIERGAIRKEEVHEIPYCYLGNVNWFRKIGGVLMALVFHKKYRQSF